MAALRGGLFLMSEVTLYTIGCLRARLDSDDEDESRSFVRERKCGRGREGPLPPTWEGNSLLKL